MREYAREQKQASSKADKVLRERQGIRLDKKENGTDIVFKANKRIKKLFKKMEIIYNFHI